MNKVTMILLLVVGISTGAIMRDTFDATAAPDRRGGREQVAKKLATLGFTHDQMQTAKAWLSDAYVDANVTDLASAKEYLKKQNKVTRELAKVIFKQMRD